MVLIIKTATDRHKVKNSFYKKKDRQINAGQIIQKPQTPEKFKDNYLGNNTLFTT